MAKVVVWFSVTAEIEIADEVLDLGKAEDASERFAKSNPTRAEIARHIAYNLLRNDLRLGQLDEFADRSDDEARVVGRVAWDCERCEVPP